MLVDYTSLVSFDRQSPNQDHKYSLYKWNIWLDLIITIKDCQYSKIRSGSFVAKLLMVTLLVFTTDLVIATSACLSRRGPPPRELADEPTYFPQ